MKSAAKIHPLIKGLSLTTFLLCVLFVVGNCIASLAQENFKIQNVSNKFDVIIQVETTNMKRSEIDSDIVSGPAKICLFDKGKGSEFQIINMPNALVYKDSIAYNPKINAKPRGLYAEEYSLVFEDFNFDDIEDMAVCNGKAGGYGAFSYNIYLFDTKLKKFILSKELSHLTNAPYLGLFLTDLENKLLVALSKSGCCYHKTEKYNIDSNKPVMVEQIIEDSTSSDNYSTLTTKKLIKGEWVTTVQKRK
jgi:hypothetical protein